MERLERLSEDQETQIEVARVRSIILGPLEKFLANISDLSKEDTEGYRVLCTEVTALIDQFFKRKNTHVPAKGSNDGNTNSIINEVVSKVRDCVEILEKLECLPLKQQLQDSCAYVEEMGCAEEIEDLQNIKELGTFILEILEPLRNYGRNLLSRLLSEKMALCICQLCSSFGLLVQVVEEQHKLQAPIYNAKKYVCDRLCCCFKMIIEILDSSSPSEEETNSEKENHFVYRMDLVLDLICSMQGKKKEEQLEVMKNLWPAIEDVFSHAMAIAQVCQPYNFKAITGASQSVITEYENLKVQLESEKPDPMLNNLFTNTLNDALYRLERKVNISVLSLVMEVFSEPFGALKKLVKSCGNPLNAGKRRATDLNDDIEEFDQLTDKAMQIGMFARACCSDPNRVLKIVDCMASLESLECELVPAIIAFYLHPESKEKRACLKILTDKWQTEINKFHHTVDLIIDSAAYSQVILDELEERVSVMSNCLENREGGITRGQVDDVVKRALVLATQVNVALNDIGADKIDRQTSMLIRELKTAIYETDAASKALLVDNSTESQQLRVIKRCELIINVIKRLQPALVAAVNGTMPNEMKSYSYGKPGMGQGDTFQGSISGLSRDKSLLTYIRTPYTVKNSKAALSIQPAGGVPRATPRDLSSLIPYIERGRTMRTDRSIMYKTPIKSEIRNEIDKASSKRITRNLSFVRQHLFSRDSFTLSQRDIDLTNESLELTGILEKLSCLTDTFSSKRDQSDSEDIESKSYFQANNSSGSISVNSSLCLIDFQGDLQKSGNASHERKGTIAGGDAPSNISTPRALHHLQRISKKMEPHLRQFKSLKSSVVD